MPPPTSRGKSSQQAVDGGVEWRGWEISLSSTSRLRTDYAWRHRSWRSNITSNLFPKLTLFVSLCLAERSWDGADCCPIRMICVHIMSQRACTILKKWRKQGWHLDWLDCGQLMVSAAVQSSLYIWWDGDFYKREVGKIKEREKREMVKLSHTALLVFFDLFESFIRLNDQFRDTLRVFRVLKG